MNLEIAAKIVLDTVVMMSVQVGRTNEWTGEETADWCRRMEFADRLVDLFLWDADPFVRWGAWKLINQYLEERITDEMAEVILFVILI